MLRLAPVSPTAGTQITPRSSVTCFFIEVAVSIRGGVGMHGVPVCVCVCVAVSQLVPIFVACVCLCAFKRRVCYKCVWVFLKLRRGVVVVWNDMYSSEREYCG